MRYLGILNLFLLILFLFISCNNNCTDPIDNDSPEKLYPYEITYDEATYKQRRNVLINQIPNNSIVLIVTNDMYLRNGTVDYMFRPASNFYYLTGFDEPNAIAIIRESNSVPNESELIMFVEHREGGALQWLGPVYGPEGAMEYFYADMAYNYEDFSSTIEDYLEDIDAIYSNIEINQTVLSIFNQAITDPVEINEFDEYINDLRKIKSSLEISSIQNAVDVSVQAFKEALQIIEPNIYEYEVEATFNYISSLNGCPNKAFPTIVASGPNINILHYQNNDRNMLDGDLVMIDFGVEYGYYASDVTRTIPVNGHFTSEQSTIYEIVLEAHKRNIAAAAPGVSYFDIFWHNVEYIIDKLIENEIISGNRDDIISTGRYRQYIPAGLGHCIGLDVHDPFPREESGDKILEENMILAFEPHVYLFEGDQTVNSDYWNVSARIEDDILITAGGSEVLSSELPIEIDLIEELME
ncbi:aminopeptidase P N-terminal domain-containing protein [Candidatus Neomarinimicrobiota bacterium]